TVCPESRGLAFSVERLNYRSRRKTDRGRGEIKFGGILSKRGLPGNERRQSSGEIELNHLQRTGQGAQHVWRHLVFIPQLLRRGVVDEARVGRRIVNERRSAGWEEFQVAHVHIQGREGFIAIERERSERGRVHQQRKNRVPRR